MGENNFGIDSGDLGKVRREIDDRYNLHKRGMKLLMWRALTILESGIIANIVKNFTMRTGTLMNSVGPTKQVYEQNNNIVGEIGNNAPYSAIQELGGIIRPKKGRFLAIPLDPVLGPDGIARQNPLDFKGQSFFFQSKKGNIFLAMNKGKGELTPLFLMREQVEIKPRPYLRPALEKNKDRIIEKFGLFLSETWSVKSSSE